MSLDVCFGIAIVGVVHVAFLDLIDPLVPDIHVKLELLKTADLGALYLVVRRINNGSSLRQVLILSVLFYGSLVFGFFVLPFSHARRIPTTLRPWHLQRHGVDHAMCFIDLVPFVRIIPPLGIILELPRTFLFGVVIFTTFYLEESVVSSIRLILNDALSHLWQVALLLAVRPLGKSHLVLVGLAELHGHGGRRGSREEGTHDPQTHFACAFHLLFSFINLKFWPLKNRYG